ncbi:hypothetical protein QQX98_003655 [Neonectria punicea]|uniref:Uncharacterized protein n=1 Tax=Neonectria punicea TaxID=979145 RepID=A0ABR1HDN7_9HYPO
MFLALERRPPPDEAILDAFKNGGSCFLFDRPIIYGEALPEIESFREILDYIRGGFKTSVPELTDTLLGTQQLTLDDEEDPESAVPSVASS